MHKHPCIDFNVPCPFHDAKKEMCYGINPARKVEYVNECPKIDIARKVYKQQMEKRNNA